MDVNPLSGATPLADTVKAAPVRDAMTSLGNDFETFLTLLTTQMRNQDPLKPIDSTEFVAQLAHFSSVEQQVRTNQKLDLIFTALQGGGASAAGLADWIGREVQAPVSARFSGAPVEIEFKAARDADAAVLVVRNDFDQIVLRRAIEPGATSHVWDGLTDAGGLAPHGSYRFEIESWRGETMIESVPGWVFAPVTEVRIEDGVAQLVLAGGEKTPVTAVTGVR